MDTMYLICAIAGSTLIICQFVLTLFGLGGEAFGAEDIGGGEFDAGGEFDTVDADHADSSLFFGILSFRTLTAAFAFFGLTGMAVQHLEPLPRFLAAAGAGVAALFVVAWLMRMLIKLNADGTARIERAVGARGTVYLRVPAHKGGEGKVTISMHGRSLEYKAITSLEELPTGSQIVVVSVVGPDTVEVAPVPDLERVTNV